MATTTSPAGAPAATPPAPPADRLHRFLAVVAPRATAVRVAGGVLTLVGSLLPWATFVLNERRYPDKATLEYFVRPLGVTGFRLHLLIFGIAAIAMTLRAVPGREPDRAGARLGHHRHRGDQRPVDRRRGRRPRRDHRGRTGRSRSAPSSRCSAGSLLAGRRTGRAASSPYPSCTWRFNRWVEVAVLVVIYVLLLLLVSAVRSPAVGTEAPRTVRRGGVPVVPRGGGRPARCPARVRPADAGWARSPSGTASSA